VQASIYSLRIMSKPSNFSTSVKVFYSFHVLLTILNVGGILLLVYSLRQTQNELKHLKDSCASSDLGSAVEIESELSGRKDLRKLTGQDHGKRERRELRPESIQNHTCEKMIHDFMKLLEISNKLVGI
jgi:hypothetical protein